MNSVNSTLLKRDKTDFHRWITKKHVANIGQDVAAADATAWAGAGSTKWRIPYYFSLPPPPSPIFLPPSPFATSATRSLATSSTFSFAALSMATTSCCHSLIPLSPSRFPRLLYHLLLHHHTTFQKNKSISVPGWECTVQHARQHISCHKQRKTTNTLQP